MRKRAIITVALTVLAISAFVLNHDVSRDLEKYEGLTLDEFLTQAVGLSAEAVRQTAR